MSKRLRLLKVIVQPVFVLDDDDLGLVEHVVQPVDVPAHEWPTYASGRFLESVEGLRQQLEGSEPLVGPC
jgi:hypothetical protein